MATTSDTTDFNFNTEVQSLLINIQEELVIFESMKHNIIGFDKMIMKMDVELQSKCMALQEAVKRLQYVMDTTNRIMRTFNSILSRLQNVVHTLSLAVVRRDSKGNVLQWDLSRIPNL